jgi:hypothetical protein
MISMHTVQIGSSGDSLRLTSNGPYHVTAELDCAGLTATRDVVHNYASGFQDLAEFFGRLADDWSGWSGQRVWESVEHDLRIDARHEFQHVQLRITLRHDGPGWGNQGWKARADLTIEPGEELARVASDLQVLAASTRPEDLRHKPSRPAATPSNTVPAAEAAGDNQPQLVYPHKQ